MVRKLKTHEQKLLKKTDFMSWQVDQQGRQGDMLRKFHVTKREHYATYNTLAAKSREVAELIKNLPQGDPFRAKCIDDVLKKFYAAGLVPTGDTLERIGRVSQVFEHLKIKIPYCRPATTVKRAPLSL
uniref:Ribosomal_S4 domain-containing protein n=2 Tax=Caenorhabditis japonica TaxID=281687 RepID=A0A8R1EUP7_CAEJA